MIHGINTDGVEKFLSNEESVRLKRGRWENEDVLLLKKYLSKEDSVLELGGCTGILSCVINKCINGSHIVFEPNPEMIDCIKMVRDQNFCNFEIKNNIISDNESETFEVWDFRLGSGAPNLNGRGILDNPYGDSYRNYQIKGISLKSIAPQFNVLFCDIEGAEYFLIENNYKELLNFNKLFFEFHHRFNNSKSNKKIHDKCIRVLEQDFNIIEARNNVYYFKKNE
tara:strand:- start:264 stop:938 length:675 start_codon:yes stop_codon:yes gene_type:complete